MPRTVDYGGPKRTRGLSPYLPVFGAPVGLVILVAAVWFVQDVKRGQLSREAMARKPAWTIEGPPCPTLPSLAEAPIKPNKAFRFNDVVFLRRFGYVECSWVEDAAHRRGRGIAVCQFSSPAVVEVKTERGDFLFQPGVGQPATVTVTDGTARCVMAAPRSVGARLKAVREAAR